MQNFIFDFRAFLKQTVLSKIVHLKQTTCSNLTLMTHAYVHRPYDFELLNSLKLSFIKFKICVVGCEIFLELNSSDILVV